ncbi:hypothetical protein C8Q78DRAFT_337141 [Trametes maxima]|nr:hypothetical protein C8Q78DRAFT_337141 [Trametes maxima]
MAMDGAQSLGIPRLSECCTVEEKLACPPPAVNRLSTEILVDIFALVPGRALKRSKYKFDTHLIRDVRDFCPLTMVCRHWREVVLGTPALWSSFIDTHRKGHAPPLWTNYAHLCTVGPISVAIGDVPAQDTVNLLVQHAHRIEALVIELSTVSDDALDKLPPLQLAPLSELGNCVIILSEGIEARGRSWLSDLPASYKTRTLSLVHTRSLPTASLFSLTSLMIDTPHAITATHLLALLARTPQLQFLSLYRLTGRSLWDRSEVDLHPGPHLAHLRQITMVDLLSLAPGFRQEPIPSVLGPRIARRAKGDPHAHFRDFQEEPVRGRRSRSQLSSRPRSATIPHQNCGLLFFTDSKI